jgi:hypothetical protein
MSTFKLSVIWISAKTFVKIIALAPDRTLSAVVGSVGSIDRQQRQQLQRRQHQLQLQLHLLHERGQLFSAQAAAGWRQACQK